MSQIVSVDVKHNLGAEEAKRRVQAGVEALRQKYAGHLSALRIDWSETRGDVTFAILGHSLKGAMEFFPDVVRVSVELPWVLALIADKAKGLMTRHTGEMLQLPPPKA
ncbi:polyhydroxyalkanoic acid system family protein [Rhodoblastus acidophilus]|uniref:Polyhydroxyalkanoic acid system family protein n=1 Tax=Candidatus Rhodoblastus alkanivorans TaxID=2954117 RepID=A0ABS9Z101_9HYPH|nr:polyhydroxyalkanoic acid system family protein [Candidatus Rhodoblastus alkanivorans]MCI4678247.1 polyhydroxyalkanoic acid system family protein [Candidatus Rhodoblastus alkanivorans]MCI4681297.1 polyhydroxyalkanoic acid system family protein [Candidatus Rhodoblastus alkanivorans]MDI4642344.1 polyhydroxyalkanoic acid system family protein [Rhodoblastus acidophilus]